MNNRWSKKSYSWPARTCKRNVWVHRSFQWSFLFYKQLYRRSFCEQVGTDTQQQWIGICFLKRVYYSVTVATGSGACMLLRLVVIWLFAEQSKEDQWLRLPLLLLWCFICCCEPGDHPSIDNRRRRWVPDWHLPSGVSGGGGRGGIIDCQIVMTAAGTKLDIIPRSSYSAHAMWHFCITYENA